jgi:hypothetical protein
MSRTLDLAEESAAVDARDEDLPVMQTIDFAKVI